MAESERHERRRAPRERKMVRVSLQISGEGEVFALTRDVSTSGAFVLLDREEMPTPGETLEVKLVEDPGEDEEEWVTMRVARVENDGIGLFFVS